MSGERVCVRGSGCEREVLISIHDSPENCISTLGRRSTGLHYQFEEVRVRSLTTGGISDSSGAISRKWNF